MMAIRQALRATQIWVLENECDVTERRTQENVYSMYVSDNEKKRADCRRKKKRFVIECRQIFSHLFVMSIPKSTYDIPAVYPCDTSLLWVLALLHSVGKHW